MGSVAEFKFSVKPISLATVSFIEAEKMPFIGEVSKVRCHS